MGCLQYSGYYAPGEVKTRMTMIEKIAKALHDDLALASSGDGHRRYWETAPVQVRELCRRQARVALSAALEASDEMIAAGNEWDCAPQAGEVWKAMIIAALTEKDI